MSKVKAQATRAAKVTRAPSRLLQRKCDCGALATGGECAKCKDKKSELVPKKAEAPLQRAAQPAAPVPTTPPVVDEVLREPGQPLDAATQALLGPRFGHDFSGVRVHTGAKAARSAAAVHARAYTVGNDIVFGAGQYQPGTTAGRELIAHELAHTIQQGGLQKASEGGLEVAPANGALEREAEAAARAVMSGAPPALGLRPAAPAVQRAAWGDECVTGTVVPATKQQIYTGAEDFIVAHYLLKRGDKNVSTRKSPVETLNARDPKEGEMIAAVQEHFRSGKNPRTVRTVPVAPGTLETLGAEPATPRRVAPATRGKVEAAVAEVPEGEFALLRPDIIDFGRREVYDVTTEKQAPGKKNKVAGYVKLLDTVREAAGIAPPAWSAGKTLPAPTKNSYTVEVDGKQIAVCFGVTDFSTWEGVLAYSPIEIGKAPEKGADKGAQVETDPYPVQVGDNAMEIRVPKAGGKGKQAGAIPLANSPIPENVKVANDLIPGMVLQTLHRGARADTIDAQVTLKRQASVVEVETRKVGVVLNVQAGTGKLTLQPAFKPLKVRYPYLSHGEITRLELDETGALSGEGYLVADLLFLKGTRLGIAFGPNDFRITTDFKDKIKLPLPGFKLLNASLGLVLFPEFEPTGRLAFEYRAGDKKLVDAVLTVTKDPNGLAAHGDLNAYLPGVDQAKGSIDFRNGHLSGRADIGVENLKRLGVKSSSLVVVYSDQSGFSFEGVVELQLPTGQTAQLGVRRQGARIIYFGEATIEVPALKPVKFKVEYDGAHFSGVGKTGFTYLGFDGDLTVYYRDTETGPEFTGEGKLHVERGKVKGNVDVKLSKNRKFSGRGDITYPLTGNLVAGAAVVLDEGGKLHVQGLLKFPKPIQLFAGFNSEKELFRLSQQFPIPALSIGPVGVVAEIGVAGGVRYGVGPGELRDVQIEAGFDPLEEQKNVELHGGAKLVVPAHAGVYLSVDGGLGVSAGVASATGGLNVRGDAGLDGQLDAGIELSYKAGRFVVDAEAGVHAGLNLTVSLGAYVQAHVGIGSFSAGTRKDWTLASYSFGLGRFGLTAPLHYASDEPFRAPTLDSIKFEKPTIDPKGLLANLFSSAPSKEQQAK